MAGELLREKLIQLFYTKRSSLDLFVQTSRVLGTKMRLSDGVACFNLLVVCKRLQD